MTTIDNYARQLQAERIKKWAEDRKHMPEPPPGTDPYAFSPSQQRVRKYGHLTVGRRDMIPTGERHMGLPVFKDGLSLELNGPPNKEFDRRMIHDHTFFELAYVYHGSFYNITTAGERRFEQGDFILLAPSALHATYVTEPDDYLFNFMITENQIFSIVSTPLMQNCSIREFVYGHLFQLRDIPDSIIFRTGDDPYLRSIAESVMLLLINRPEGYRNAAYYGAGMLFSMLEQYQEGGDTLYHLDAKASEIMAYMRSSFPTLTLRGLAEHFSYSPSYLSHQIKKWTGSSFSQLIQKLRLSQAVRYLENTSMKHQEIAAECGFCDVSSFCKTFKQVYKVPPTEYRRVYRQKSKLLDENWNCL